MCEQFSFLKHRKKWKEDEGKSGKKIPKAKVFKKLHDIENWNMQPKCHLALMYNKIVHFIKCVLERVNKNYES